MNTHPEGMGSLQVDQDQIERFVSALFRYADEGTFVSPRAFDQFDRTKPPLYGASRVKLILRDVVVSG